MQCAKRQQRKRKLNSNENIQIKNFRQRHESNNTLSIYPFKQSLKEDKLQLMNRPFIPFKRMCICMRLELLSANSNLLLNFFMDLIDMPHEIFSLSACSNICW